MVVWWMWIIVGGLIVLAVILAVVLIVYHYRKGLATGRFFSRRGQSQQHPPSSEASVRRRLGKEGISNPVFDASHLTYISNAKTLPRTDLNEPLSAHEVNLTANTTATSTTARHRMGGPQESSYSAAVNRNSPNTQEASPRHNQDEYELPRMDNNTNRNNDLLAGQQQRQLTTADYCGDGGAPSRNSRAENIYVEHDSISRVGVRLSALSQEEQQPLSPRIGFDLPDIPHDTEDETATGQDNSGFYDTISVASADNNVATNHDTDERESSGDYYQDIDLKSMETSPSHADNAVKPDHSSPPKRSCSPEPTTRQVPQLGVAAIAAKSQPRGRRDNPKLRPRRLQLLYENVETSSSEATSFEDNAQSPTDCYENVDLPFSDPSAAGNYNNMTKEQQPPPPPHKALTESMDNYEFATFDSRSQEDIYVLHSPGGTLEASVDRLPPRLMADNASMNSSDNIYQNVDLDADLDSDDSGPETAEVVIGNKIENPLFGLAGSGTGVLGDIQEAEGEDKVYLSGDDHSGHTDT